MHAHQALPVDQQRTQRAAHFEAVQECGESGSSDPADRRERSMSSVKFSSGQFVTSKPVLQLYHNGI
jgi:hypothetical protein